MDSGKPPIELDTSSSEINYLSVSELNYITETIARCRAFEQGRQEQEALDAFDDEHTEFEETYSPLVRNADGDPYGP